MILAMDTSNHMVGLALYDGSQVLAENTWQTQNYHTVELAPAVDLMLKRCGVAPHSLQLLAVALGPGSFTALRIGLAFARGLALAISCPLVGIPSLDILAAAIPPGELPLMAALQMGRGRLAFDQYDAGQTRWKARGDARTATIEEMADAIQQPTLVCCEANALQRQYLAQKCKDARLASPALCLRRPALLAELAWERWQAGAVNGKTPLAPIYLHSGNSI
jgi:tRNA threonylcarbamoyladenosine biosynthesis protein TsaB